MRLFFATVCLTGAISASTCYAGNDEPLTGGSGAPGQARFEVSPAHEYLVARARAESMHRQAIMQHYDWLGINIGRPNINSDVFHTAAPIIRTHRIYSYPGFWGNTRSTGF